MSHTSALSLIAEDMGLTPIEVQLVRALLSSTPVALTGQETMIPFAGLSGLVFGDGDAPASPLGLAMHKDKVIDSLKALVQTPRMLTGIKENSWLSFCLVSSVGFADKGAMVHYSINTEFLSVLQRLSESRKLPMF